MTTRDTCEFREQTDLEAFSLSQNKRFWRLIDEAIERGRREGYVDLADL